jgi:hypothetical protein
MIEILMYQNVSFFVHVMILPFTEGIISLSLVISFSMTSLIPSLDILSMISLTFVHLGPLISLTACCTSRFLVDQVLIIMILSSILTHARNAGDHFITSSTWI